MPEDLPTPSKSAKQIEKEKNKNELVRHCNQLKFEGQLVTKCYQ